MSRKKLTLCSSKKKRKRAIRGSVASAIKIKLKLSQLRRTNPDASDGAAVTSPASKTKPQVRSKKQTVGSEIPFFSSLTRCQSGSGIIHI